MIVAISGTPGTGKSRVATLLADRLGWDLVELNRLAEEKDLYMGYDEQRECKVVDIEALAEEVSLLHGNAIVESHYAHDMPADLIVILRASPAELRSRLAERGWTLEKIEENVEAELVGVCLGEARDTGREVLEIDTTDKKPSAVAEEVARYLRLKHKN